MIGKYSQGVVSFANYRQSFFFKLQTIFIHCKILSTSLTWLWWLFLPKNNESVELNIEIGRAHV